MLPLKVLFSSTPMIVSQYNGIQFIAYALHTNQFDLTAPQSLSFVSVQIAAFLKMNDHEP